MSTEQPLTVGEADANQPATDQQPATDNSTTQTAAPGDTPQPSEAPDQKPAQDEEERRPSGEDFGSLLDQFEQEQSSLIHGGFNR